MNNNNEAEYKPLIIIFGVFFFLALIIFIFLQAIKLYNNHAHFQDPTVKIDTTSLNTEEQKTENLGSQDNTSGKDKESGAGTEIIPIVDTIPERKPDMIKQSLQISIDIPPQYKIGDQEKIDFKQKVMNLIESFRIRENRSQSMNIDTFTRTGYNNYLFLIEDKNVNIDYHLLTLDLELRKKSSHSNETLYILSPPIQVNEGNATKELIVEISNDLKISRLYILPKPEHVFGNVYEALRQGIIININQYRMLSRFQDAIINADKSLIGTYFTSDKLTFMNNGTINKEKIDVDIKPEDHIHEYLIFNNRVGKNIIGQLNQGISNDNISIAVGDTVSWPINNSYFALNLKVILKTSNRDQKNYIYFCLFKENQDKSIVSIIRWWVDKEIQDLNDFYILLN